MNEEAMEIQVDNDSQSELVDSSCSDSTQIQKEVRSVAVQIPVAVFTAHRGYDWSKLPNFVSHDEADGLFEKVMSIKTRYSNDLCLDCDSFKGVLYEGKYVFAFRLMTVEKWDQAKRDSNYCACAFIPYEILKDVDIERLLEMEYFLIPSHNPASFLNYYDEDFLYPSAEESGMVVSNFKAGNCGDFEWRLIGSMLFEWGAANDKWFIARMISRGESRLVTEFGNWDERYFNDVREENFYEDSSVRSLDGNVDLSTSKGISELESDTIKSWNNGEAKVLNVEELGLAKRQSENLRSTIKNIKHQYDGLRNRFENLNSISQTIREERDNLQKLVRDLRTANNFLESQVSSRGEQINLLHIVLFLIIGVIILGVILLVVHFLKTWLSS